MSVKQMTKVSNVNSRFTETKLFQVLNQFDVYTRNRLKKFVESPYFNNNESLIVLFEHVDIAIRTGESDALRKHELWTLVSKEQKLNDQRFRKMCSELLKLIEKFLIQEEFDKNQLQQAEHLLAAVHARSLDALKKSAIKTANWLSEKYYFRPASYYYSQYAFQREIYSLSGLEIGRSKTANIDQIASNLDVFFIAEKLRYYCDVLSRKKVADQEYNMMFMSEIIQHIREHSEIQDIVPINLYYQTFLTYTDPTDPTHFVILRRLIDSHIKLLPDRDAKEILFSALNYCISQVNQGNTDYLREYLELSELGIQKGALLANGALSPWTFRNVVVIGLRLGDFEWVQRFINLYKDNIEVHYRSSAVSFNLANLYFYQKNYSKVFSLLQEVEYEDPTYNRNSKIMLLLTYYELGELESLSSLLSSFEIYLRRNKSLPENRKAPYFNLIKFMRSLVKISDTDAASLRKLRKKVADTESVVNKAWLLEKIDALL